MIYSGQPRHLKECFENHRSMFWDANPDAEIDVFAHIWYDEAWVGSYFWDQYKDRGRWEADLKDFMVDSGNLRVWSLKNPRSLRQRIFILTLDSLIL